MNFVEFLLKSFKELSWQSIVMFAIGLVLIVLAVRFKMEPALLLPIGFGAILVNIPFPGSSIK